MRMRIICKTRFLGGFSLFEIKKTGPPLLRVFSGLSTVVFDPPLLKVFSKNWRKGRPPYLKVFFGCGKNAPGAAKCRDKMKGFVRLGKSAALFHCGKNTSPHVVKIPYTCKSLSNWQKLSHIVTLIFENLFSVARIVPKL